MQVADLIIELNKIDNFKRFKPRMKSSNEESKNFIFMGVDYNKDENTLYYEILSAELSEKETPILVEDLIFITDSYPDNTRVKAIIKLSPTLFPLPFIINDYSFFQDNDHLYFDFTIQQN